MKKFLLSSISLFVLFAALQSCQKDAITQKEVVKDFAIDTVITAGSDYYLNLASYGDEGYTATILQAGDHSSISRLENESDMFTSIYHYEPDSKFTGKDEVTLSIKPNPQSVDSTIIYINITVK